MIFATAGGKQRVWGREGLTVAELIAIEDFAAGKSEAGLGGRPDRGEWCCEQLERGNILLCRRAPLDFPERTRAFLLRQRQTGGTYHKNIAYRPQLDRLTGFAKRDSEEGERLRDILKDYSARATQFLRELLPPYAKQWQQDFASFRPLEEQGRQLRLRARNDLLHIDAFPTRPTNGDRILRIFTNLNPTAPRVWTTAENFEVLVEQFGRSAGLPRPRGEGVPIWGNIGRGLRRLVQAAGVRSAGRSPYDAFMVRFHHFLKENQAFQQTCAKKRCEFPPGCSWIVLTDMVCHAVLSGQFAMEQTFIVLRDTLLLPEKAPVNILERLCGGSITNL